MVEIIKLRENCSLLRVDGKEVSFSAIQDIYSQLIDEFDESVEKMFNIGSASKVIDDFSDYLMRKKPIKDDPRDNHVGYSFCNDVDLGSFQLEFSQLRKECSQILEKRDGEIEMLKQFTHLNLILSMLILLGGTSMPLTDLKTLTIANTKNSFRHVYYMPDGKFRIVSPVKRKSAVGSVNWMKFWPLEKYVPERVNQRLAYYLLVVRDIEIRLFEGYYEYNIMRLVLDSESDDVMSKLQKAMGDYHDYLFVSHEGLRNSASIYSFIDKKIKKAIPGTNINPRILVELLSFYIYELITLKDKDLIKQATGVELASSWNELTTRRC